MPRVVTKRSPARTVSTQASLGRERNLPRPAERLREPRQNREGRRRGRPALDPSRDPTHACVANPHEHLLFRGEIAAHARQSDFSPCRLF